LFSQVVQIREGGIERQVAVAEAFLLYLRRQAAKNGGGPASRAYGALIKQDARPSSERAAPRHHHVVWRGQPFANP
jgi:hypothetical protein